MLCIAPGAIYWIVVAVLRAIGVIIMVITIAFMASPAWFACFACLAYGFERLKRHIAECAHTGAGNRNQNIEWMQKI